MLIETQSVGECCCFVFYLFRKWKLRWICLVTRKFVSFHAPVIDCREEACNRRSSLPPFLPRSMSSTIRRQLFNSRRTRVNELSTCIYGGGVLHRFSIRSVKGVVYRVRSPYTHRRHNAYIILEGKGWEGRQRRARSNEFRCLQNAWGGAIYRCIT